MTEQAPLAEDRIIDTRPPWDPRVFWPLAIVSGFGAAGVLAGLNYRRLGRPDLTWPTMAMTVGAFAAFLVALSFFVGELGANAWLAFAVNVPPAFLLERLQRPDYETWKERFPSAGGAGWGLPVMIGAGSVGIVLAVLFVPVLISDGLSEFTGEPTGTIAFNTNRDGNNEIYVMNGDGSDQVNITNNEAVDSEPSWSPDGFRLAFSSFRTGPANLFTMSHDGSDVRQLTEDPGVEGRPRWSPDGSRIAFFSFRQQRAGLLWVMNADGSDVQPVLEAITPSRPEVACAGGFPGGWLPDGQHILYRGSQGGIGALQICSIAPDGSDIKIILSEAGVENYYPTLSPDGRKIAFTSDRDGNIEVYVMNTDGGSLRRLTDNLGRDGYPAWSPDGQWIAFHSDRDGDFEIYIMRPDGSDLRQLTSNDDSDMEPSWSPR